MKNNAEEDLFTSLSQIRSFLKEKGCVKILAKVLAKNDNSKQQVYFSSSFQFLNLFPNLDIQVSYEKAKKIIKIPLNFSWIGPDGGIYPAEGSQLIYYPQYPEVRFSGFLQGNAWQPIALMNENARIAGRILFFGIKQDGTIIGHVVYPEHPAAHELVARQNKNKYGVFIEIPLDDTSDEDNKTKLLSELKRIHLLGWINSKFLDSEGNIKPCLSPNCGGYTLEAELNIKPNGYSKPDYLGWEVKQHTCSKLSGLKGVFTLMTPEPKGGIYKEKGVVEFLRLFGYPAKNGTIDRINFGGIHKVNVKHPSTGLILILHGYDYERKVITDVEGYLALTSEIHGIVAASWSFISLMELWNRKHNKAVYVPSGVKKIPTRQYRYGNNVYLFEKPDFENLLNAFRYGLVYYDPAIKMVNASTPNPAIKRRSQFRVNAKYLQNLYGLSSQVELLTIN